jgi:hypothetical protein
MDTFDGSVVRDHTILVHPTCSALSDDGRIVIAGSRHGEIAVSGPAGETIFQECVASTAIVRVGIGGAGRLAVYVDYDGGAGCVDLERGGVLIGSQRMAQIVETL